MIELEINFDEIKIDITVFFISYFMFFNMILFDSTFRSLCR